MNQIRLSRKLATVAIASLIVVALAACSGGSPGGTKTAGPSSSALAQAAAAASAAEKPPTTIGVSTPLTSAPKPGKTFVYLASDLPTSQPVGVAIKKAVESQGWTYKQIGFQTANPATVVTAMKEALQYHPSYVALIGVSEAAGWNTEVPAYKAAGVKIMAILSDVTYDSTVIADLGGPALYTKLGKQMGDWFIADSKGKGSALVESVNSFAILAAFQNGFTSEVKAKCPGCTTTDLDNTLADLGGGQIVPSVVSQLRAHPSIKYLVTSQLPFMSGLPSALSAAGISNTKVAGANADSAALTALKAGDGGAAFGNPLHYLGYLLADTAFRDSEGMSFDKTGGDVPLQLLTSKQTFTISDSYDVPSNAYQQFLKLWSSK